MTENNRSVPPSIPVQEAAPQGTNAWNVVNTGSLNAMSRDRGGGTGRRSFVSETVESDVFGWKIHERLNPVIESMKKMKFCKTFQTKKRLREEIWLR